MKKFEYKTVEFLPEGKWLKSIKMENSELENLLNELGKDGWELVNSLDYSLGGNTLKFILIFKKELV